LSHGPDADRPSVRSIPKNLAGRFHATQSRFRSNGIVIDGFGDLGRGHCLAGKRQFTQDHLAYGPTGALSARPPRLGSSTTAGSFAGQHLHRRSKTFLPGFDQSGFLGFLFAQGEGRPSISFQHVQVLVSFLKGCRHLSLPFLLSHNPGKR
jgi:hypothetical protein